MRVVEAGKEAVMGIWSQIKILGHKDTVKDIADGRGNLRAPVHVQIEPTEACNFRCTFCHWHNPELKEGFTSFDFTGKRSLDTDCMLKLVDELAELGVRAISFTGAGDPLMHGGLWKVLERIRARKIDYAVTSNFAMPLREELIEGLSHASWLRWSMNAGGFETFASIHNPRADAYKDFMRQRENIKRLAAERRGTGQKSLSASFVITGGNEDDIVPAANLAKELGCGSISYRPDTPFKKTIVSAGYSSKVIENLKKAERLSGGDFAVYPNYERLDATAFSKDGKMVCYYMNHSTYIAANGDLYPCCYTRCDKRYVMGNIKDGGFKAAWFSEKRVNFYKSVYYNSCPPCHHGSTNKVLKHLYGDTEQDNFV